MRSLNRYINESKFNKTVQEIKQMIDDRADPKKVVEYLDDDNLDTILEYALMTISKQYSEKILLSYVKSNRDSSIHEDLSIEESLSATINDFVKFAKEHDLTVYKKNSVEVILKTMNDETITIRMISKNQFSYNDEKMSIEEIYDELSTINLNEELSQVNEGGILKIIQSLKGGDAIEILTAVTSTNDFAKSSAKREIVHQLNKRGLLPDSVSDVADMYYKFKPLAKKLLSAE